MRSISPWVYSLWFALLACPFLAVAAGEERQEQALKAIRRQQAIQASAMSTVSGFGRLLEEIQANRLGKQAGAEVNRRVRDALHGTATGRMERVIDILEGIIAGGGGADAEAFPAAAGEMEKVRRELLALLKTFGAREQAAAVRVRLQRMLEKQRSLNEGVREFARETLGKPRSELAPEQLHRASALASSQNALSADVKDLGAFLDEVTSFLPPGEEGVRELENLHREIASSGVRRDMSEAGRSVNSNRLGQAAMAGDRAENKLERLLALASGDAGHFGLEALDAAEREVQALSEVLEEQQDLLCVTRVSTEDDTQAFTDMEAIQSALEHRTREAAQRLGDTGIFEEQLPAVDAAAREMARASDALMAYEKGRAIKEEQEAVTRLRAAVDSLQERLSEARSLAQEQLQYDAFVNEWQRLQQELDRLQQDLLALDEAVRRERRLTEDTRTARQEEMPALESRQKQIRNDVQQVAFAPENSPLQDMQQAEQNLAEGDRRQSLHHEEAALVGMQRQRARNAGQMQALQQQMEMLRGQMLREAARLDRNMQQLGELMQQQQQLMTQTQARQEQDLAQLREPQGELGKRTEPQAPHASEHMQNAARHLGHAQRDQALRQQALAMQRMNQANARMQQRLQVLQGMMQQDALQTAQRSSQPPREEGREDSVGPGGSNEQPGARFLPGGWHVNLPPKAGQDIRKGLSRAFPEEYGNELEAYYRAIAGEAAE